MYRAGDQRSITFTSETKKRKLDFLGPDNFVSHYQSSLGAAWPLTFLNFSLSAHNVSAAETLQK